MYQVDDYTVSLLHFDEGIKDETGKVWTAVGNPVVSTDQSKFGGKSLYLDGSSYLDNMLNPLNDFNFTVDWWEYRISSQSGSQYQMQGSAYGANPFSIGHVYNSNICFSLSSTGKSWDMALNLIIGPVILNEWTHYALVRKGNVFYAFQNGVLKNTFNSDKLLYGADLSSCIGAYGSSYGFNGYIDEFRISNIARWTENFNPNKPLDDGKFLLTITLAEEVEREYPVTKDELDAFIKWYDSRANGTGSAYYTFDKFLNRKDYIVYDKILTFEVTDFSK
jgi:hypothetical protein